VTLSVTFYLTIGFCTVDSCRKISLALDLNKKVKICKNSSKGKHYAYIYLKQKSLDLFDQFVSMAEREIIDII